MIGVALCTLSRMHPPSSSTCSSSSNPEFISSAITIYIHHILPAVFVKYIFCKYIIVCFIDLKGRISSRLEGASAII